MCAVELGDISFFPKRHFVLQLGNISFFRLYIADFYPNLIKFFDKYVQEREAAINDALK